ncbi:DUF1707 SHOCT-like domain-containing protein [Actinomadura alba]|uniref:DUF1707 domain-containing protein n=1 Tax=Actinomadura alba TaxID=406431 RepID=A0ABR7LJ79_9ACTN|nr:DUF1707 domain-containing protein [Actinomadura alba]MBC6464560.1 DUF1707 domain-containing protein [Actinomadura alba]
MPPNPEIRASDADRDRVAAALREHCAEGRITMDELHERLETVYAAKTVGALQDVTADLPETDLYELPVPATRKATMAPAHRQSGALDRPAARNPLAVYAAVNLVTFTIWLISCVASGSVLFPWWIFVAGPWGVAILAGILSGSRGRRS